MILARLAKSLRRQDWTTFAIEFVLVIAGVLVALEVDNWNQERVEAGQFRQELQLLRAELAENRARLDYTIERSEYEIRVLGAFQGAFHGASIDGNPIDPADYVFTLLTPLPQLIREAAVDRVLGSDHILAGHYESLRQHLEDWNRTFTGYLHVATDVTQYRNTVMLPLFTESHSQIAVAQRTLEHYSTHRLVEGEGDPLAALLSDPRVENTVVFRLSMSANLLHHVRRLDELSVAAMAEIDKLLSEDS